MVDESNEGGGGPPMSPDDYAAFMSDGLEEMDKKKEDDNITEHDLERVRIQLRQAGMITDYCMQVINGIRDLKHGAMKDFNFVRGHVKRVRVKRELNGNLTVITY
jgi:hypothetical protein